MLCTVLLCLELMQESNSREIRKQVGANVACCWPGFDTLPTSHMVSQVPQGMTPEHCWVLSKQEMLAIMSLPPSCTDARISVLLHMYLHMCIGSCVWMHMDTFYCKCTLHVCILYAAMDMCTYVNASCLNVYMFCPCVYCVYCVLCECTWMSTLYICMYMGIHT